MPAGNITWLRVNPKIYLHFLYRICKRKHKDPIMIKITSETLPQFQEFLARHGLDAWLLYDFHELNPFARQFLPLEKGILTRRWFYLLPAKGAPKALVHRIEENYFEGLPGDVILYEDSYRNMSVAISNGSAAAMLRATPGRAIRIRVLGLGGRMR